MLWENLQSTSNEGEKLGLKAASVPILSLSFEVGLRIRVN